MFLQMLKDDFHDVRLNIISKLEQVNSGKIDSLTLMESVLNTNSNWNRQTLIVTFPCHCSTGRGQAVAC